MSIKRRCLRLIAVMSFSCVLFGGLAARPGPSKKRWRRGSAKKTSYQGNKTTPSKPAQQAPVAPSYVAADLLPLPSDVAVPVQKSYSVDQGNTVHLKIKSPQVLQTAYTIFAGTQYNFTPVQEGNGRYECFLPIDCEQNPGEYKVVVRTEDELGEKKNIACAINVAQFHFKTQRGFKISRKKLQSMRSRGVGGGRDSQLVKQYQKNSPPYKRWQGPFIWPINVRQVTSPFGEIRISHGFGKRHHYGLDLAEHHKAPIHAANHGVIANKTTTPTSGNVIAIDHGLGVFTIYCHMSSFDKNINIGDTVKKGQRIGFIGQTGYASGPHLHLEMRIKDANNQKLTAVDFTPWTKDIY